MLKVLKKFDIDDTYCIKDNAIKEGCFVGMYNKDEKKIESAVTQTSLETNKINDNLSKRITDKIKEAISKETSIVIADCNLHSKHLCDISNKCLETKTLLFVRQFKFELHHYLIYLYRIPHSGYDSQDIFEDDC